MQRPEVTFWKAEWDSPHGRQVRIIKETSKFATKKLVKHTCNVPVGNPVYIRPATKREIAQHAEA